MRRSMMAACALCFLTLTLAMAAEVGQNSSQHGTDSPRKGPPQNADTRGCPPKWSGFLVCRPCSREARQ